jgi:hypothetical protein
MPAGTNPFTGAEVHGNPPRTATIVAVPATATSPGTIGEIARDNSFAYFCTAPNTWRRVAIASW